MALPLVCYRTEEDEIPVLDWLDSLGRDPREKCLTALSILAEHGFRTPRRIIENLGDGIYELRTRLGTVNYRILFFFYGTTAVVLTHGFTKEREIPPGEIPRALRRKEQFEAGPERHAVEVEL